MEHLGTDWQDDGSVHTAVGTMPDGQVTYMEFDIILTILYN
jgi:hypothetical protein